MKLVLIIMLVSEKNRIDELISMINFLTFGDGIFFYVMIILFRTNVFLCVVCHTLHVPKGAGDCLLFLPACMGLREITLSVSLVDASRSFRFLAVLRIVAFRKPRDRMNGWIMVIRSNRGKFFFGCSFSRQLDDEM